MVLRATPVARETSATPPRPAARASQAANRRLSFSFRTGESASKRAVIAAVSIIQAGYSLQPSSHGNCRIRSLRSCPTPDSFLPIRLFGLGPLANAMLDGGRKVRRDYFETVRQMEPADALLLTIVARPTTTD